MSAPPILNVDSIPEEGLALSLTLDAAWLAEVLEGTEVAPSAEPATARVRLDLDGRNVLLTGDFALALQAECVACLAPLSLRVAAPFTLHLSPETPAVNVVHRGKGPPPEVELSAEELDADTYSNGRIDLGQWLREQVLLEVPLHPRHEGECPEPLVPAGAAASPAPVETPPSPGLDPRFAPLLSFVSKTKKE